MHPLIERVGRCLIVASLVAGAGSAAAPAAAQSSARKEQVQKTQEIPRCTKRLGTVAVVEPDNNWWQQLGLGSPEAIIKTFVMKSGCFGLVDRGKGLASRNIERALADQGELQEKSNIGRKQVKAADYFIVPDLVTRNNNSGGAGIGGFLGGMLGGTAGGLLGGINVKKKEANVTLTLVNSRTTEQERLVEGFARKKDIGFGGGLGLGGFGGAGGVGGGSYENTEIGQVIVLAYLDAYTNLVRELGGLPEDASAAAPVAR
jgi:curli biogenesis system outer membrane secretion channel CsgG